MTNLLIQFSYLQALDILTTLAFLLHGAQEANPLLRILMGITSPLVVLITAKTFALGLAAFCWLSKRQRILRLANTAYACLVVWNLVALIVRGATA